MSTSLDYRKHAIQYLYRLRTVQNAVLGELQAVSDLCEKYQKGQVDYDLASNPQWQSLENRLDYIYRTYRRL